MKLDLQYVSDSNGNPQAVQLPIDDWKKLMSRLDKYERKQKVKSDLQVAFAQVAQLRKKKTKQKTLAEFINEL